MTQPASVPANLTPQLQKAPEGPLDARLREVMSAIDDARYAAHDLVGRLRPILPPDFGDRALPARTRDGEPPSSPLAADLRDLADSCADVVHMIRGLCESVDL